MKKKPAKRKTRTRSRPSKEVSLGQNIRQARTKANLTQLALAHAIGYTGDDAGAYISRVENDGQAPRLDTLQRIADALGVAVCSLLPGNSK